MDYTQHWSLISLLLVAFIAHIVVGPRGRGQGPEMCRKKQVVQNSMESLDRNVQLGGHVWIHVYGEQDRPSKEKPVAWEKSMFRNAQELGRIWLAWIQSDDRTKAICSKTTDTYQECVPIGNLATARVTKMYKCTAVQSNVCVSNDGDRDIVAVRFSYAFKTVGSRKKKKSQWILNTAYPSENGNCE